VQAAAIAARSVAADPAQRRAGRRRARRQPRRGRPFAHDEAAAPSIERATGGDVVLVAQGAEVAKEGQADGVDHRCRRHHDHVLDRAELEPLVRHRDRIAARGARAVDARAGTGHPQARGQILEREVGAESQHVAHALGLVAVRQHVLEVGRLGVEAGEREDQSIARATLELELLGGA
jgi:hypothetical protein